MGGDYFSSISLSVPTLLTCIVEPQTKTQKIQQIWIKKSTASLSCCMFVPYSAKFKVFPWFAQCWFCLLEVCTLWQVCMVLELSWHDISVQVDPFVYINVISLIEVSSLAYRIVFSSQCSSIL